MSLYDNYLNDIKDEDKDKEKNLSSQYKDWLSKEPSQRAAQEQKEEKKPNIIQRIKSTFLDKKNPEGVPQTIKEAVYSAPNALEKTLWGSKKDKNVDEEALPNGLLNTTQAYRAETVDRIKELEARATALNYGQEFRDPNRTAKFLMNKKLYEREALALEEAKKAYEKDTGLKAEDSLLYRDLTEKNKESLKAAKGDNPEVQLEMEKVALNVYDQFLENTVSDRGFIKAFYEIVKDPKNVAPFIKDIITTGEFLSKYKVMKKYERGEELNPNQQALFNMMRAETLKSYIKTGVGDKAGEVAGNMPKYAIEFALTGGLYSAGKTGTLTALGKTGQTVLEKEALKAGGKELVKFTMKENAARITSSLIGAAVQTSGGFIPTISSKTAEYMLPEYDLVMADETQATMKKMDEGDGFVKALAKAGLTTYVEIATERSGVILEDSQTFLKRAIIGKYMQKVGVKSPTLFAKMAEEIGWNGILAEVFEEELAEVFQSRIDERPYNAPLVTPEGAERLLVETLGIGAFGGIGRISGAVVDNSAGRKAKGDIIDISDLPAELEATQPPVEAPKPSATEYVEGKGVKFREEGLVLDPEKRKLLMAELKELSYIKDKTAEQEARIREVNKLVMAGYGSDISNVKEILLKTEKTATDQARIDFFTKKYEGTPEWTKMLAEVEATRSESKKVPTTDLMEEARKYKSAEEFVSSKNTMLRGSKYEGVSNSPMGTFLTNDKNYAETFAKGGGKVNELYVDKSKLNIAKSVGGINDMVAKESWQSTDALLENQFNPDMDAIKKLQDKGYNAFESYDGKQLLVFDNNLIKTKSQLTDIYNQATGQVSTTEPSANEKGIVLYHSSTDTFESGKPEFDSYFGNEQWAQDFKQEFGENEYRVELPKDAKILDLDAKTPEAENFIKKWDGTREDFYDEDWTDKRKVLPEIKKLGYEGAKFGNEYLLTKELIDRTGVAKETKYREYTRDTVGQFASDKKYTEFVRAVEKDKYLTSKEQADRFQTTEETIKNIVDDFTDYAKINTLSDKQLIDLKSRFLKKGDEALELLDDGAILGGGTAEQYKGIEGAIKTLRKSKTRSDIVLALDSLIGVEHLGRGPLLSWAYASESADPQSVVDFVTRTMDFLRNTEDLKAYMESKGVKFRVGEGRDVGKDFADRGFKISSKQVAAIENLNKRFFGDGDIRIVEQIVTNNKALGSYRDGMITILDGKADVKDTYMHEAVHKYLDVFTTREQHIQLLEEGAKKYGISDFSEVEERIAEDFIGYANNRGTVKGKVKAIFDKLVLNIQAYLGNAKKIDALYSSIYEGEAKKAVEEVSKTLTKTAQKKKDVVTKPKVPQNNKVPEKPLKVTQKTELPKEKQPVGRGSVEASRFAERLQEELLDSDPARYEFEDSTAKYNVLNLDSDAEKAVSFLDKNPQESLSIALGLLDAPVGQTTNAIGVATMLKAREEGNYRLYAEIRNSLSLRNTRLGQEIISLRGRFNIDSPENFIKQVIDRRMEKLGRSLVTPMERLSRKVSTKEAITRKIDVEVAKAKKAVSMEQTKVRLAQDIIDALRC